MTSDAKLDVMTIIMTQAVMHSCLMAATVPCIRTFLSAFNSWMGSSLEMQLPQKNRGLSWRYTVSSSEYTQHKGFTQDPDGSNGQAMTRSRIVGTQKDTQHYSGYDPQIETRSIQSDSSNTRIIRKMGNWPSVDGSPARTTGGSEAQIHEAY